MPDEVLNDSFKCLFVAESRCLLLFPVLQHRLCLAKGLFDMRDVMFQLLVVKSHDRLIRDLAQSVRSDKIEIWLSDDVPA